MNICVSNVDIIWKRTV